MSEFRNDDVEGSLANEILMTIRNHEWNNGGVNAYTAIVALTMVLRYITEYCSAEENLSE